MSSKPKFAFALEYVDDVAAAKRFYVDVMGLTVEREHPTFVQFHDFAIAGDEAMGSRKEREIYWSVPDADAALAAMSKHEGLVITMPMKKMPFGRVFGVRGAGGQPCYLVEFAKDRPSERA